MTASLDVPVYIGIGSNVEPAEHLQIAVGALAERYQPLAFSSVYQNPPVGFSGADFLNMVVGFTTPEPLARVSAWVEEIHVRVGRVSGEQRFGPRTLDLDLLLYGMQVDPGARVPRADVLRYGFVLGPMAEIAPDLRHPVTGVAMGDAWARWPDQAVLRNLGPLAGLKGIQVTG